MQQLHLSLVKYWFNYLLYLFHTYYIFGSVTRAITFQPSFRNVPYHGNMNQLHTRLVSSSQKRSYMFSNNDEYIYILDCCYCSCSRESGNKIKKKKRILQGNNGKLYASAVALQQVDILWDIVQELSVCLSMIGVQHIHHN